MLAPAASAEPASSLRRLSSVMTSLRLMPPSLQLPDGSMSIARAIAALAEM
jgi:hypothetical protein